MPPFRAMPDPEALRRAVARIAEAQRPIVVAGGGVVASDARRELVAFCEAFALPVATSLNAKDCVLEAHPLNIGVPGSYSRRCANEAIAAADLVIFVGSQAGVQVTHFWRVPVAGTPIVQIDINPVMIGRNYPDTLPVLADAKVALAALRALAPAAPPVGRAAWITRVQEFKKVWREAADVYRTASRNPMRPEERAAEISNALPRDGILVSDTGHSGMWTGTMVEFRHPEQSYIRCAGSLGWGLPGAIGVQCAAPDRKVVLFTGDGGFYYHLGELETAARYGINVVVVCNNNSSLNQEYHSVVAAYGGTLGPHWRDVHCFRDTDFGKVAEPLGCVGLRVTTRREFREALGHALTLDQPVVIDAVTDAAAMAASAWVPPAASAHA